MPESSSSARNAGWDFLYLNKALASAGFHQTERSGLETEVTVYFSVLPTVGEGSTEAVGVADAKLPDRGRGL